MITKKLHQEMKIIFFQHLNKLQIQLIVRNE